MTGDFDLRVLRILGFLILGLLTIFTSGVQAETREEAGIQKSKKEYLHAGTDLCDAGEYVAAIHEYQQALEQYPDDLDFRRLLAVTYGMSGQWRKALEEQKVIIETSPEEDDYYMLGLFYHELGEYEKAVQAFHEEATRYGSEEAWQELATSYFHIEDYDGAVWAYRKTLELNPGNDDARLYLIGTLTKIHDYQAAVSEIAGYYETPSEKILLFWGFFKHLVPPFILLSLMFFFSTNHRLSPVFCDTTATTREMIGVVGSIMLFFIFLLIAPHVFFNPLAPYYREKIITSMYLANNRPELSWPSLLSFLIPFAVLPAFFMRRAGIDIKPLFAVDREKAKKILRYLFIGALLVSVFIIANIALFVPFLDWQKFYDEDAIERIRETGKALPLTMKLYQCVVSSSIEELCIRGWIFLLLRKHFKVSWAIFLSSIFFVFNHYDHPLDAFLFTLFVLGIIYAYLVHKTHSLWPSSILHIAHNSLYFFLLVYL